MTPDELAAIRARDANWTANVAAIVAAGFDTPCSADRRALLAEVDRLTADLADTAAYAALGRENERARIRAAVEGMFQRQLLLGRGDVGDALTAVLAAIGGGGGNATVTAGVAVGFAQAGGEPPAGGIEQFQDEDR